MKSKKGGEISPARMLEAKIRKHDARIGVLGLGYVGLPLGLEFAANGFPVWGIDVDSRKIKSLVAGRSYVQDIPSRQLKESLKSGNFTPTTSFDVIRKLDVVIICVPTPLRKTRDPDISYIVSALEAICSRARKGMLVVLESTSYPGTTEELMVPRFAEKGLKVGKDFFLAFSPERVDPGNKKYGIRNTPKVVGGISSSCGKLARILYQQAIETVVSVSSARAAEMIKLLENTFRSVNIALVNEIALICDRLKLDPWEVISAAATKPFGFMPFYPGPGLGGHCIPIDPHYLSWKLRTLDYQARFIELASEINGKMPHHVLSRIVEALNRKRKAVRGSRILIAGVAYKRDTNDIRESPALDLMRLLREQGARVKYHDPYVPSLAGGAHGPGSKSQGLTPSFLRKIDCAVIVTDHAGVDYQKLVDSCPVVVDTRNATKPIKRGRAKIIKL